MAISHKPTPTSFFQQVTGHVVPAYQQAKRTTTTAVTGFGSVLESYPVLKAFVFTMGATSAVPLIIFAMVTLSGGAFVLGLAGSTVALVQGSFLALSSFVLSFFLLGSLAVASIATFWFAAGYFGLSVVKQLRV